MRYIVTHAGDAHRDDFLCVCVGLALYGQIPVFRRDPTEAELNDHETLVVDVGGRLQPELNNFDHHQLPRDAAPDCALSLWLRHLGLWDSWSMEEYMEMTSIIDAKGPFAAAKTAKLPRFPGEFQSPIELELLRLFGSLPDSRPQDKGIWLWDAMAGLGNGLLKYFSDLQEEYNVHKLDMEIYDFDGVPAMAWRHLTNSDVTGIIQRREQKDAGILVSKDDRGPGWMLYRYNDHVRINFLRVDESKCIFRHVNGFIAKTVEMSFEEAVELAKQAVIPQ